MNTTHANKMNNNTSTMRGSLVGWVSKAFRYLLGRLGASATEKAESAPAPAPIAVAASEQKRMTAESEAAHRKHAKSKNRPWHPRTPCPRVTGALAPAPLNVPVPVTAPVEKMSEADGVTASGKCGIQKPLAPARRAGLRGCVDARLAAGDGPTAVKLLARIARKDPSAYAEMSRIYEAGDGLAADARTAKRYARLAKKEAKAARQTARRQKCLVANSMTGLDYANLRGAEDLLLARDLEQCAQRQAEGRKFQNRSSRGRAGKVARTFRHAA